MLCLASLRICVLTFFSSPWFDISFVVVLAHFFHLISFRGIIYFFFITYAIFCCFLLNLLFLCLCSLLPASIETGCSLEKTPFHHYLVFQGLLQFLCSMLGDFKTLRLKLPRVYLQVPLIHFFDDCCLLVERLLRCSNCLVFGLFCIFVALLHVQY